MVRAVRERWELEVALLRLLDAERPRPHGGRVTYVAELWRGRPPTLEPWPQPLDEQPLRPPWARPGGPAADLRWAADVLASAGRRPAGEPTQHRAWNLSSLWRLPFHGGDAWLKHVPSFFAHEGAILDRLAGGPVPALLARDGARVVLADAPGDDLYEADAPTLVRLVDALVGIQRAWVGRTGELLALGLPDWRAPALGGLIADTVARAGDLSPPDRRALNAFVRDLPARFARLAECGLPDTLVHGDFHPGNARGSGSAVVLLDWGDSGVGHPLLDQPAFLDRVPRPLAAAVADAWSAAWRATVPGSDPEGAASLIAPIAAARQAVIYRHLLDGIEPAERPYHAADVPDWLRRTVQLAA